MHQPHRSSDLGVGDAYLSQLLAMQGGDLITVANGLVSAFQEGVVFHRLFKWEETQRFLRAEVPDQSELQLTFYRLSGESGVNLLDHLDDVLPVLSYHSKVFFKRPQHLLRSRRVPASAPKTLHFDHLPGYDALGFGNVPIGFRKPVYLDVPVQGHSAIPRRAVAWARSRFVNSGTAPLLQSAVNFHPVF